MQLIVIHDIADFAAFKTAFDAADEHRRDNGLSVLQLWQDASGGKAVVLYTVSDRSKAERYLATTVKLLTEKAGVSGTAHHFVKTA